MEAHREKIEAGAKLHPKLEGVTHNYGTAGFRDKSVGSIEDISEKSG